MAATYLYTLVCLTAYVTLAYGQIACFDCDPRNNPDGCRSPLGDSSISTAPCSPTSPNGTAICLSAFLRFSGNQSNETGIYRGCKNRNQDVSDFCDWWKQETDSQNLTVVSCVACNTTRCNTIGFSDDGISGTAALSNVVLVLVLNAIFVLAINSNC